MGRLIAVALLALVAAGRATAAWEFSALTDQMTDQTIKSVSYRLPDERAVFLRQFPDGSIWLQARGTGRHAPGRVNAWISWRVDGLQPRATLPLPGYAQFPGHPQVSARLIGVELWRPNSTANAELVELLQGTRLAVRYGTIGDAQTTLSVDLTGLRDLARQHFGIETTPPAEAASAGR